MTPFDRPFRVARGFALGVAAILVVAACSSTGASATPTAAPATQAPASQAPASAPASSEPSAGASASTAGDVYELKVATASIGKFLTGEGDKTLYVFKQDTTPGTSSCTGACATNWPPFILEGTETTKAGAGVTGALATIKRDDGTTQVTYKGAPLYYFAADTKAGDTNGQGKGGVWFIANP